MPVNPTTGQELQNAEQTDNFLKLDESLRENRHTFAPESLQYCSQKHCTLVPKFTALHFPEITVFLFPVYNPTLKEGFHYSIMYYGGKILSNLSFDYDAIDRSLIPSLRINQNAFVIMDRDGKRIKPRLNQTKLRIESEVGLNSCWITQGREIENYLTNKSLTQWLTVKYGFTGKLRLDSDKKLSDIINESFKQGKLDYSLHKNKYSSEIVQHIGRNNLNSLDLQPRITLLVKRIKEWN